MLNILSSITSIKPIAIVVLLCITHGAVYMIAQANQRATTAEHTQAATLEGVKTHAKIQREVIKLPDTELDSRLSKWLRD